MPKDLKLHEDVVTIAYWKPDAKDGKEFFIIGAERDVPGAGETVALSEKYLSFITDSQLFASICESGLRTQRRVRVKWRYSHRFDANLLWCELAKEESAA